MEGQEKKKEKKEHLHKKNGKGNHFRFLVHLPECLIIVAIIVVVGKMFFQIAETIIDEQVKIFFF